MADAWTLRGELVLSCSCTVFCPCTLSLGQRAADRGLLPDLGRHPHRRGPFRRRRSRRHQGRPDHRHSRPDVARQLDRGPVRRRARPRSTPSRRSPASSPAGPAARPICCRSWSAVSSACSRRRSSTRSRARPASSRSRRSSTARSTPITGKDKGEPVVIRNTEYWIAPDVTVARADKSRVRAFGRNWNFAGRSAEICRLDWGNCRRPEHELGARSSMAPRIADRLRGACARPRRARPSRFARAARRRRPRRWPRCSSGSALALVVDGSTARCARRFKVRRRCRAGRARRSIWWSISSPTCSCRPMRSRRAGCCRPLDAAAGIVIVVHRRALFRRPPDEDAPTTISAAFRRCGTARRSICCCCGRRPWLAAVAVVASCAVLTFVPFPFMHPLRVRRLRALNLRAAGRLGGAGARGARHAT